MDYAQGQPRNRTGYGQPNLATSFRSGCRSTSDFGFQGDLPTHPKLLDWLAVRFMESDWNIKAMHKLIMTSQAYRRSSSPSDECFEKDPLNDLLWRFDMRRLGAEEVRDSVLAAKGTINLEVGGPSVTPPLPEVILATASRKGAGWEVPRPSKPTAEAYTSRSSDPCRCQSSLTTTWRIPIRLVLFGSALLSRLRPSICSTESS